MDIEDTLHKFDIFIDKQFQKHYNTDVKIYSEAFKRFPTITSYTNLQLYNWYYGNFLSKVVTMVFQPYLYSDSLCNDLFEKRLSHIQMLDSIWTCYFLIVHGYCDPAVQDYYDDTAYSYVANFHKDSKDLPYDLRRHIKSFMYIFRAGKDIVLIQQYYVKRWYKRYIKRRKSAVAIIEKHWLEYILNPNTRVGYRKMKAIEKHFQSIM